MAVQNDFHEKHVSIHDGKIPSEKSFGFFVAGILVTGFSYTAFFKNQPHFSVLVASVLCLIVAIKIPQLFFWPNLMLYKIGTQLRKVWTFAIIVLVFFGLVTPLSLIQKTVVFFQRKPNNLNRNSYWITSTANSTSLQEQH